MFENEPLCDFTLAANVEAYEGALKDLEEAVQNGQLSAYPVIAGEKIQTSEVIPSIDPGRPEIELGRVYLASTEDAERALKSVRAGFTSWRTCNPKTRAGILRRTGQIMSRRRFELAALVTREAAKPWKESDADVVEAIDFCNYYAEEIERLSVPRKLGNVMGEENIYFYQPRGVVVVISPWNFPMAIACGMTVAALAAGNTAILKPARQTSLIAAKFADILYEAGVPPEVFVFFPATGSVTGNYLVEHPLVDMICFTGSKEVGLDIIKKAAVVRPGQRNVKKVVAEMGGKNAIIVDEDADLDEAIKGVIHSAFGYAGQKCSACSRLIGVGTAYEPLMERLTEAARDIIVGQASSPATMLCPVIDKSAQANILNTIAEAKESETLAFQGEAPSGGCFVPATIFKDVSTESRIWREEIFGPVLACTHAESFEKALELANDSQYALTGAVYSRSPRNIERAQQEFRVGNLYINRGSTGAIVNRQPFGGFKMSGVGSKAGGPDYLIQFMEPRTVTENTMRRGFAPDLISD